MTGPGGLTIDVPAGAAAPHADRVGFWTVAAGDGAERVIAVNPAASESDLTPAPSLLVEERTRPENDTPPRGHRGVLAWVAVPLLALLAAEWLLARRRSGVSRRQFRVATAVRVAVALALVAALLDLAVVRPGRDVAVMLLVDASDSLGVAGQGRRARLGARRARRHARRRPGRRGALRRRTPGSRRSCSGTPGSVSRRSRSTPRAPIWRARCASPPPCCRPTPAGGSSSSPTGGRRAVTWRPRPSGWSTWASRSTSTRSARAAGPDAAVAEIDAPGRARQGEAVTITATVTAYRAGPALVTLLDGGDVVQERAVDLAAGPNEVAFSVVVDEAGLARYQVRVTTSSDSVGRERRGLRGRAGRGPAAGAGGRGSARARVPPRRRR